MANKPENTVEYKGFRICKDDIVKFKQVINDCKYAYFKHDGSRLRPVIVESLVDGKEIGIILKLNANGVTINGEYSSTLKPDIQSLTKEWDVLLREWITFCGEDWMLIK